MGRHGPSRRGVAGRDAQGTRGEPDAGPFGGDCPLASVYARGRAAPADANGLKGLKRAAGQVTVLTGQGLARIPQTLRESGIPALAVVLHTWPKAAVHDSRGHGRLVTAMVYLSILTTLR